MAELKSECVRKDEIKHQEIVVLNVGGKRFSTSKQTLTWVPDSFFSSLMSGRIPSLKDDTGAIFIDRDPESFGPILNFMRTKNVDLRNVDLKILKHEAEFFGILPLVKRLSVCDELEKSNCGSLLFYCQIKPPVFENLPPGFGGAVSNHESTSSSSSLLPPPPAPHIHPGLAIKTEFSHQVLQLIGHGNCIAVAYHHCICVLGVRESRGWEVIFSTPLLDKAPQRVSLNTRSAGATSVEPILAAVIGYEIKVWTCSPSTTRVLASFDMKLQVDGMFFIGKQLVAISNTGKVVVWQSVQKHWQLQEVEAICSYDTAGSFLLLGCTNGSIYYIDMEKFPVRMKDNDLLVTQLFEDPCKDPITALSVYVTPNIFPGSGQNWMEVAYGTQAGTVRVVVRHPENIGQAPQIFQSYNVHTCPIMRVVLGERHLISVCAENHVRSWTVTRFRGRISTQPGSTPIASFKVLSLEGAHSLFYPVNSIGPFGERDEEQVFIQRVIPETNIIFVRSSSTGHRVCKIESVDDSNISAYYVHECEAVNRTGMRSRRFIFTGHVNGSVQVWDLTSALELSRKPQDISDGGPSKGELLELLQNCDISPSSRVSSTFSSRAPSPSPSLMSLMFPSIKPPSSRTGIAASPLSTPALNVGRSKSSGGNGSLFQPICISHSNSNTSFSDAAALPKESCKADGDGDIAEESRPLPVERKLEVDPNALREEQGRSETGRGVGDCKQKSASVHIKDERCRDITDPEGSIHQRSRSNEIDYVSLRSDAPPKTSAFRSPPGSMHTFKPLSGDNHRENNKDPLQTSRTMVSPTDNKDQSSCSSPRSDAIVTTEGGLEGVSSHKVAAGELSPGGQAEPTDEEETTRRSERFSWLKDFDSTLWSNYFTSDNSRYSDC